MSERTNRRSFLARTAGAIGAVSFSGLTAPTARASFAATPPAGGKKLLATTDYVDNILGTQRLFGRSQMDALHAYLRRLGVARHQWIVDTIWDLYPGHASTADFDILAEGVESAHAHGLEFYAEIKPFEGGGFGESLPLSLPFPPGAVALRDIRGIYPYARPFVAAHPHLCLKRRPGSYESRGPVTAIRLVKGNDQSTRVGAQHLSLWTSASNNGFTPYTGPISFRETIEWRPTYPTGTMCRVLHLEGLRIPEEHTYFLVQCAVADGDGDFANERGCLVELAGSESESMPCILSTGRVAYETHRDRYLRSALYETLMPYLRMPEVRAELFDEERARAHYRDFYSFDEHRKVTDAYTLDREGYVAVCRGKPEYMLGNLHPIYPEVREHWLDLVRYCLDRGVDGVNIRHSNHTRSPEDWDYGFNEPAIAAAEGSTDFAAICRANGDAYTQFLREARELVKSRGRNFTIHLYAQMIAPDDRPWRLNYLPPNFDWQWETWVKEIADDLEFRGVWTLRPWNLRRVLDTFSAVCAAAGKPLYYQGNQKELSFDGPLHFTQAEIDMVKSRTDLDGYVLYETATISRMDDAGEIVGSPQVEALIRKEFPASAS